MEALKRFGGTAGFLIALSGSGIVYFVPDHRLWGWVLVGLGMILLIAATLLNSEDLLNLIRGRPFRHGANALFYSLLVLGIVGAVDFLAARHNRRFDLTGQGTHTLSPQTIRVLKGLGQDGQEVTIAAFYSSSNGGRQKAIDLLEEYRYHNPRITIRMIDPLRSPAEVRAYGVEQDGTIIISSKTGEARITASFGGELSEQELTNAFVKATATSKPVICATTGHGERGIQDPDPDGFKQAAEALGKENFEVREVRLLEGGGVPPDCGSLIVAGASHSMLQPELEAIEVYLREGGRALILAEPRASTGLEPLLLRYGLKTGRDFIVDVNPLSRMFGGSPAAPVVYEYGTHDITKEFEGLATIFPTVGSVETTTATEPGVTTTALAHTSAQSWGETGEMADRVSFDEGSDKIGPLNVAAVAVKKHEEVAPAADPNAPVKDEAEGLTRPRKETRLIYFGDSDYASNSVFMTAGNRDLFLNTVAWLNERSDLISIRPKTQAPQPVILTGMQGRILTWYTLLFPLLALVVGVGVHLRRRRL